MERIVIVPSERNSQFGRELSAQASSIVEQITAQNIASVIGEAMFRLAANAERRPPFEIVLWARSDLRLLAAWTSVSPHSDVVGIASWQTDSGLVAEIFATETSRSMSEPILQAAVYTNLGDCRGRQIASMHGVPILAFGHCMGVLTSVGYEVAVQDPPPGIENDVSKLSSLFGLFSELKIIKLCLGI